MLNLNKYICNLLIGVALLSSMPSMAGGGWAPRKGKGYLKLGQNVIVADQIFGPNGDLSDITTLSMYTTSFYGEYGFTDKWSATLYMPFFVRSTINSIKFKQSGQTLPGDEANAFGDTDIGIKYGLLQDKPVVVGVSLTLGLPLGDTDGGKGKILQSGDGEFNQLLRVDASHSFRSFYGTLYAGYNNRTRGFSDDVHLGVEVGYTVSNFSFEIKVRSINSTYNGSDKNYRAENSFFANNQEYLSYTPQIAYTFKDKVGLAISAGYAASGKQILADPNYGFGLFMKL